MNFDFELKIIFFRGSPQLFPIIDEILQKLIEKLYSWDGDIVQSVIDVLGKISLYEQYFDLGNKNNHHNYYYSYSDT